MSVQHLIALLGFLMISSIQVHGQDLEVKSNGDIIIHSLTGSGTRNLAVDASGKIITTAASASQEKNIPWTEFYPEDNSIFYSKSDGFYYTTASAKRAYTSPDLPAGAVIDSILLFVFDNLGPTELIFNAAIYNLDNGVSFVCFNDETYSGNPGHITLRPPIINNTIGTLQQLVIWVRGNFWNSPNVKVRGVKIYYH